MVFTVVDLVVGPVEAGEGCQAHRDFRLGWQAVYSSTNVAKSKISFSWDAFLCASIHQLISTWNNLGPKPACQESGKLGICQPLKVELDELKLFRE